MRIINLVENTEGASGCGVEHGLCFYIETEKHKLLMDTGQTGLLLENAEKLGIDLTEVDTVVLSHGHYDHGGGILPFAKINPTAKIYVPEAAFGEYYSMNKAGEPHYIGLAKEIQELPQVIKVSAEAKPEVGEEADASTGIYRIDDELSLFSGIGSEHVIPSTNQRLKKKTEDGFVQDDFAHEQCLVISERVKKVLLSGCAHHGILNIMDRYCELFSEEPDFVISGFRLVAAESGKVIAANYWGKFKTASQMVMICLLIADIQYGFLPLLSEIFKWIALILTVISLIIYLADNKEVMKE